MRYYLAASLARSAIALVRPVPRRRFSLAATKTDESRVAIGEVVLTEPGGAVIRDTAGVGGGRAGAGGRWGGGGGRHPTNKSTILSQYTHTYLKIHAQT